LVQRDGLDIFDGHFRGDGYDLTKFAEFAHSVIENSGDDAAVAVSGWTGVTFAETEAAHEAFPFLSEFEAHAVRIVVSAGKAEVFR
jgi:hypothetical protein